MAYYYITTGQRDQWSVYKSVGARSVKRIYGAHKKPKGHTKSEFIDTGMVYAPYIPIQIQAPIISIQSAPVVGQARKLSAKWNIELEQDLQMMHGIEFGKTLKTYRNRNTIPFHIFKKEKEIIFESKHYHDIVFQFAAQQLEEDI
jgi:hypothetical protein